MDNDYFNYDEFLNTDELLVKIDSEIYNLEHDLKKSKTKNKKIKFLRNLKKSFIDVRLILPYVVTGALSFTSFSFFGHTPFCSDNVKGSLYIKRETDTLGNVRCEEQYEKFDNFKPTITYFSSWNLNNEGYYERVVRVYNTSSVDADTIDKMLSNDIKGLDEAFGKPISTRVEKRNTLSKEEFNSSPYLLSTMFSIDEQRYILKKEPFDRNLSDTVTWAAVTILLEMIPLWYRYYYSGFNYNESIRYTIKQYECIDIESMKKRLEDLKKEKQRLRS